MKQVALAAMLILTTALQAKDQAKLPVQVEVKAPIKAAREATVRAFVGAGYTMSESQSQLTFSKPGKINKWLKSAATFNGFNQQPVETGCNGKAVERHYFVTVTLSELDAGRTLVMHPTPTQADVGVNTSGVPCAVTNLMRSKEAPKEVISEVETLLSNARSETEKP